VRPSKCACYVDCQSTGFASITWCGPMPAIALPAGFTSITAPSIILRQIIIERVAARRIPTIYQWPTEGEEGGLLAYGPSLAQLYRDITARRAPNS
jgi:hypothetical protein